MKTLNSVIRNSFKYHKVFDLCNIRIIMTGVGGIKDLLKNILYHSTINPTMTLIRAWVKAMMRFLCFHDWRLFVYCHCLPILRLFINFVSQLHEYET